MRTASEPVRGILRSLLVGFTPVFAGDFFAAVFLVVFRFPAFDLLRAFLPELIFFIVSVILHFGARMKRFLRAKKSRFRADGGRGFSTN